MNAEQKQRAIKLITYWRNRSITTMPEEYFVSGDCMTDLLQELIDAPEPEQPNQSEQHLEMVNAPAPSVPDGQLQAAFDRGLKAGNEQAIAQQIEIHKLHDLLAVQQPEQPTDLVRDAEFYRWLRESNWYVGPDDFYADEAGGLENYQNENFSAENLDTKIKAAIERDKLKGGAE